MAYEVVIHESAASAFRDTISYLELITGGTAAPKSFSDEFFNQMDLISRNPELYGLSRIRELAELGYRAALVKSYIVLYYVSGDEVHIAHLFHQSQNYARYMI